MQLLKDMLPENTCTIHKTKVSARNLEKRRTYVAFAAKKKKRERKNQISGHKDINHSKETLEQQII